MEEWAYQKSLQFTKGLREHSPTWMEMMERRKRGKKGLRSVKNNNIRDSSGLDVTQQNNIEEDNIRHAYQLTEKKERKKTDQIIMDLNIKTILGRIELRIVSISMAKS